jgi:tetratricopeptide (TPR) repeat protein
MSLFDSSIAYYRQVLSQVSCQLQLDEIALGTIHNDLAYAYRDSRRYQEAFEHYQIALKLREKQGPAHEEDLATTYSDFGWLLMNMGDV